MSNETNGEYSITEQRMRTAITEPTREPVADLPSSSRVDWIHANSGSEQWLLERAADR